ncbi:hypothetical protein DFH06DRAFT_273215 [Mycena polygramma]|nr:hypothetical protein DFH06DRAFT_273215 [Mycena polygramma]
MGSVPTDERRSHTSGCPSYLLLSLHVITSTARLLPSYAYNGRRARHLPFPPPLRTKAAVSSSPASAPDSARWPLASCEWLHRAAPVRSRCRGRSSWLHRRSAALAVGAIHVCVCDDDGLGDWLCLRGCASQIVGRAATPRHRGPRARMLYLGTGNGCTARASTSAPRMPPFRTTPASAASTPSPGTSILRSRCRGMQMEKECGGRSRWRACGEVHIHLHRLRLRLPRIPEE